MTHHERRTGDAGSQSSTQGQSSTQSQSGMAGQSSKQSMSSKQGVASKQGQSGMHGMGGESMQSMQMMSGMKGMQFLSDHMQQCIQNCLECHSVCLATIQHCLTIGGKHVEPQHLGLMMDCAEICQTSANFMLRNSQLHPRTCGVCAEVCEACAQSCEQLGDDEMMRMCAEMCRRCAQSCREMAGVSM